MHYARLSKFSLDRHDDVLFEESILIRTEDIVRNADKTLGNVVFQKVVEDHVPLIYYMAGERNAKLASRMKSESVQISHNLSPVLRIYEDTPIKEIFFVEEGNLKKEVLLETSSQSILHYRDILIIIHDILKSPFIAAIEALEKLDNQRTKTIKFPYSFFDVGEMDKEIVMKEAINLNYNEITEKEIKEMLSENNVVKRCVLKDIEDTFQKLKSELKKVKKLDEISDLILLSHIVENLISKELSHKIHDLSRKYMLVMEKEEMLKTALRLKARENRSN